MITAHGNHAVGTPVLGRPNLSHFDGICDITVVSPLDSACIGRLGRGVPTDSNEYLSMSKATPRTPPLKREGLVPVLSMVRGGHRPLQ